MKRLAFLAVGLVAALAVAFLAVPALAAPSANRGLGLGRLGICGPGSVVKEAAEILGITVDQVYEAKTSGKTILDLAAERGISAEELVAKIVEKRTAEIEALVASGELTRDAADSVLENLQSNVEAAVERECTGVCEQPGSGRGSCRGQGYGKGQGYGRGQGLRQGRGFGCKTVRGS